MTDRTESALVAGQRVVVLASPFYGWTATLVRPTTLLRKKAWVVDLDTTPRRFAVRRTRIVESALAPIEDAAMHRADSFRARASRARFLFSVLSPLLSIAWMFLDPLVAGLLTLFVVGLFIMGFLRRR